MFAQRKTLRTYPDSIKEHFVAHRGANNFVPGNNLPHRPENTVHAQLAAYENGATYVECDIHKTKDNKIIVLHDDTIRRTGRFNPDIATTLTEEEFKQIQDKNVSQLNYAEQLSQVDVGCFDGRIDTQYRGAKIPLLSDYFDHLAGHPERKLIVELKYGDKAIVGLLTELVKQYNLDIDQLMFISFDMKLVEDLKKRLPNHIHMPVTSNYSGKAGSDVSYYSMYFALTHYYAITGESDLRKMIDKVKAANLDGIYLKYSPEFAKYTKILHENNLLAGLWGRPENDTIAVAKEALEAGSDYINTNQPRVIFEALDKANLVERGKNEKSPII